MFCVKDGRAPVIGSRELPVQTAGFMVQVYSRTEKVDRCWPLGEVVRTPNGTFRHYLTQNNKE